MITRNRRKSTEEGNPYWMSFSDLMATLLAIFILVTVVLVTEIIQKKNDVVLGIKELKKAEQVRRDIVHGIQNELKKSNIIVELAENDTLIRIPDKTLSFASGDDKIPNNQDIKTSVRKIGQVLYNKVIKANNWQYLDTIFIEGHTDGDRIYYKGKGNWGLSTDRAVSIWKFWQTTLNVKPAMSDLTNSSGAKLFSVSGYADSRKIKKELTDNDKAKNRRIDIKFTIKKPKITELENIVNK